jgi:pyrroloquinoline quinone biosynthesis protein B
MSHAFDTLADPPEHTPAPPADAMVVRVLGSSAGGGFPQWNCNCTHCTGVRAGHPAYVARTQSSIAWSRNRQDWLLFNASPDILTQLQRTPELQPARALRDSGIAAVLLMDAQIDHVTGLLMLRERRGPLPLWATPEVLGDVATGFPLLGLLSHYCGVDAHPLALNETALHWDFLAAAHALPLALDSKPPPYSPHRAAPRPGDNIGITLVNERTGKRLFYAPGLADISPAVWQALCAADVVLVDGTFWTGDEMIRAGLSAKHALDMGHLPQSGPGGMLEHLARLPATTRKVLIHINNTNPVLDAHSPERQQLHAAGVELAHDGMELVF